MTRVSLRRLLLGSVLSATAIAFATFAVFIDTVQRRNQLTDIDDELRRAEQVVRLAPEGVPPTGALPQGPQRARNSVTSTPLIQGDEDFLVPPIRMIIDPDGTVLAVDGGGPSPFDQATRQQLARADGNRSLAEPRVRVRAVALRDDIVDITALPLDGFDAAVSRFRTALALGGSTILLVVAGVLWAVTGRLIRPVERMARAASEIADGHLDTEVGPPSGSSETAGLSLDLDRMLTRLRGALAEANRSRDRTERFLADMAHEIRTPLTALKGYSDLYAKGMLENTEDVDRAMERIGSESERLATLTDRMLELARDGSADEPTELVDMGSVANEVAQDLRAAHPSQTITVELGPGNIRVRGVRSKIHQAILNLGSNACHYNPPPDPIEVIVAVNKRMATVTVIDHGPGIDPADLDQVFLPFFRSDAARTREHTSGAGLGLALTRQFAEHHNGTATVLQPPGGGSAFVLSIPLVEPSSTSTTS